MDSSTCPAWERKWPYIALVISEKWIEHPRLLDCCQSLIMPGDVRKDVSEIEMREGIIRVQADGFSRRSFPPIKIPAKPKFNTSLVIVTFPRIRLQPHPPP